MANTNLFMVIAIGFVVFIATIGGIVFYFTGGAEQGVGQTASGDFSANAAVYSFEKTTAVDIVVKNQNKSALTFRSCVLMVPEEVSLYTNHLPFQDETRMVAFFGKAPSINYEFQFKCRYIKESLDYEDEMTIRGPVIVPQQLKMAVKKSDDGLAGTVEEVAVKPRVYATFGVEPLRELKVSEAEDLYRFSLSGDGKQRVVVIAFGGLDEAALFID